MHISYRTITSGTHTHTQTKRRSNVKFIEAAVVTRCDTCCTREWNIGGSLKDIFYAWPFFVQCAPVCASCQIPTVCLNINSLHNSEHHKNSNGAPQFVIYRWNESKRHRNYGNVFNNALLFSTMSHLNKATEHWWIVESIYCRSNICETVIKYSKNMKRM